MTASDNQVAPLEIGLCVRDLARMVDFYVEALGCRVMDQARLPGEATRRIALASGDVDLVWLQTQRGERIKLLAPHDPAVAAPAVDPPNLTATLGVAYLTFYVRDLDAWAERAFAHGATPLQAEWRTTSRVGAAVAFFRDPEGTVIELVQRDDLENYRPDLFASNT